MDKKQSFKSIFALLLIFIYTVGCAQTPETEQPAEGQQSIVDSRTGEEIFIDSGGSISLSMGYPETLNPLENRDLRVDRVLGLIFLPLFTLDDEQQISPCIAREYKLSADGSTLSIVLNDDLVWQDGTPITAADVIFSLQTIKNAPSDSIYKPAMANVESCYQSSRHVAVINYSEPYGGCAYNLCFPVIPKHHYRTGTNDMKPLGSGCYRMADYREKHHMTLEAVNSSVKGTPYIQRVDVMLAPNLQSDTDAFRAGMTDVLCADLSTMGSMNIGRDVNATAYNSNRFEFIGFNFTQPVLRNNSFRQGLAYGIPLDDIVKDIYLGNAARSITPINPASALSAPAGLDNYSYNPELAHNMMAASGYDLSKLTLSILVNNDSTERLRVANIVAGALRDMGITVEIEAVDFGTYFSRLQRGDFQLYIGGTEFTPRIEPSMLLQTGGTINYGKYSDAHMNELLAACKSALGDENYKKSVRELQAYCADELPCIGIAFKSSVLLTSSKIKGDIHPSLTSIFDNEEKWYISEEK
ncbi:MAG: peptide ABC transporter substrate-binding protein [Firmicutes bacterium]|nr:peptide ABC transporter substrate-binding protein [Bacillota bacterium]